MPLQSKFVLVLPVRSNPVKPSRIYVIEISQTLEETTPGDFISVNRAQNCIGRVLCIDFDLENNIFLSFFFPIE